MSLVFVTLLFLGSLSSVRAYVAPSNPDDRVGMLWRCGWITVAASLFALAAASIKFFNPGKADTVKWEYILFCLPLLSLPAVAFFDGRRSFFKRGVVFSFFLAFCLVGLY